MKRERTPISRPPSVPRTVTPPVVISRSLTGAEARLRNNATTGSNASAATRSALANKESNAHHPPAPTFTKSQLMEVNLQTMRRRLAEAKENEAQLAAMVAAGEEAVDESVVCYQLQQDEAEAMLQRDAEHSRQVLERIYAATHRARLAAERAAESADESAVLKIAHEEERRDLLEDHRRAVEAFDALLPQLDAAQAQTAADADHLLARQGQATLMKSSTYGLSSDAAACVLEDERITKSMEEIRLAAIATEVQRRQQFSLYEELKGTIRVYCRVKAVTDVNTNVAKYSFPNASSDEPTDMFTALDTHIRQTTAINNNPSANNANTKAAIASSSADERTSTSSSARASELRHCIEKRSLTLTQTRLNATSTGTKESSNNFQYDRVFGPTATQEEVFNDVGPLVDCAVDGYRVCIMAYGQTGSGKTYTMEGNINDQSTMGIIPRAIEKVFDRSAQLAKDGWSTRVVCYFVEIYNDTIRDLLETNDAYHRAYASNSTEAGKAHEIQHRGRVDTVITNVKEVLVTCPSDIHRLLAVAVGNRSVAKTLMNERSSRSHYVFTMRIEGVNERINQRSLGSLCLVDLAGSERVNDSGAQGQRFKEAVNINKSLSFLGDCIVTLGNGGVVSWRICRLTYLLQNYLGGEGAKVLMIVNVSEKEEHTSESLSTLRFATKVNQTHIAKANKRVQQL